MTTYTTIADAIEREIVAPIEASGVVSDAYAEYDIEAIRDETLGSYEQGFACLVPAEHFWDCVRRHAIDI